MSVLALSTARNTKNFLTAMETLRIYRPRVVLHGPVGMGQGYVGPTVLHHLEGYHVWSLELGSILSDLTWVCFLVFSIHFI